MNRRQSYQAMIRSFPGGMDAMAAALGMSASSLSNRIYERKNQSLSTHDAMQMQEFTGTTCFAEAIAGESGGVFVKIENAPAGDLAVLEMVTHLWSANGRMGAELDQALDDGAIDHDELKRIRDAAHRLHQSIEALCARAEQMAED